MTTPEYAAAIAHTKRLIEAALVSGADTRLHRATLAKLETEAAEAAAAAAAKAATANAKTEQARAKRIADAAADYVAAADERFRSTLAALALPPAPAALRRS